MQLGIEMLQTQICFFFDNFFQKIRIWWQNIPCFENIFWAMLNFTPKKTWSKILLKSPKYHSNGTSLFSIGKILTKRKLKIEKRNSSDLEVFNCKISMENLINDQYVAKGWLNFCTSYLVHSQIWLKFSGMTVTFSASSYGWMTATLWYKQNFLRQTLVGTR